MVDKQFLFEVKWGAGGGGENIYWNSTGGYIATELVTDLFEIVLWPVETTKIAYTTPKLWTILYAYRLGPPLCPRCRGEIGEKMRYGLLREDGMWYVRPPGLPEARVPILADKGCPEGRFVILDSGGDPGTCAVATGLI